MNPNENTEEKSGNTAAGKDPDSLSVSVPQSGDTMKRAAAKQLIEKYYYQLTDGCGDPNCQNEYCLSSGDSFTFKDKSKNEMAVQAVQLFRGKAKLCDTKPSKVPRSGESEEFKTESESTPSSSKTQDSELKSQKPSTSQPTSSKTSSASVLSGLSLNSTGKPSSSVMPVKENVKFLTEEKILELIKECKEENSWSKLIRLIGSTYNNPDSLVLSFRKKDDPTLPKEYRRSMEEDSDKDKDDSETVKYPIQETASNEEAAGGDDNVSLDIPSLHRAYDALMKIPDHPFQGALINALMYLSKTVDMDLKFHRPLEVNPHYINLFIIVMEMPLLEYPEFIESAYPEFCKTVGNLPLKAQAKLARVWSKFGADRLESMVQSLHQLITVKIVNNEGRWGRSYSLNDDEGIAGATRVMKILYYACIYGGERDSPERLAEEKAINEPEESLQEMFNVHLQGAVGHEPKELKQQKDDPLAQELGVSAIDCRKPLVDYEEFVNELLNEYIEIETDFKYKIENDKKFSFMNHGFILTTSSKHTCMYFDNRVRMFSERRTSIIQTLMHGLPPVPFLRLRVRRDHLIDDALVSLEMVAMDNPQDLKKQLFVEFEGEQGLDEGGVSKEFFQLVIEEIFNPDFGMFTYSEETRQFWFNPTSFENDGQFTLIGIMLGLAIYNSTIVDVHFPAVVYRKLLGKKGTFQDLIDVDPTLARSLQSILDYAEDDIEEVFGMTFQIGYKDVFGCNLTHDLKEKGDEIFVNQENKKEFVDLYSDFLLNKSIEKQFRAFKRGFHMVTNESPLRVLFRPDEVELLICGSSVKNATDYDGGFTAESPSVRHFWEVVHEFTEEQKRQLLQFTTGTDRVPVGGLAKLKLTIARNGPDSERLPTAHTCFNVLLLPDYSTKEKLQERLLKAITYSKGFGML
ncbi:hypothetical protein KUTeg_025005 [Tegillarca granosa]|uniref:HECT-type E3 ubiquitin transferase n=1 Tax=Tegillarca granosa TaxID=220873 RepID=A0ABQ9DYU3_TEGGR|nr:hypothetical protein KUTeg_025005 [Tegillarca granosa]